MDENKTKSLMEVFELRMMFVVVNERAVSLTYLTIKSPALPGFLPAPLQIKSTVAVTF